MNTHIAFAGHSRLIEGSLLAVAQRLQQHQQQGHLDPVLVFELDSGRQLDIDISGSDEQLLERFASSSAADTEKETDVVASPGRGRPKLGVVGREVTLLPRHWDWLGQQRGGASATLRRLIDQARKQTSQADAMRAAQDRTNRFMAAIAGDLAGFEDATRALYAGDGSAFSGWIKPWPKDVRNQVLAFSQEAFD